MARLFSKEYHKVSNTWYFREDAQDIDPRTFRYSICKTERGLFLFTFTFSFVTGYQVEEFQLIYDTATDSISSCKCIDYNMAYSHNRIFSSLIKYCYENLTTKILDEVKYSIYYQKICKYGETTQKEAINLHYEIEGLYDQKKDIVKIYLTNCSEFNFNRLISYLKIEDKDSAESFLLNYGFLYGLSSDDLFLCHTMYKNKRSIGYKKYFFSFRKENFAKILPAVKAVSNKLSIKETGEKLIIKDNPVSLEFSVSRITDDSYHLQNVENSEIHNFFIYHGVNILKNNVMQKAVLPFDDRITDMIFSGGIVFKGADLPYFKVIVPRLLTQLNHHIDFDEGIDFPPIEENTPEVYFIMSPRNKSLSIYAYLEYKDSVKIPMSFVYDSTSMLSLKTEEGIEKWYYISEDLSEELYDFLTRVLGYEKKGIDEFEWFVSDNLRINYIKHYAFKDSNPNWHIIIDEEIKKDFVKTINLVPEITLIDEGNIDWFSYKVVYKYHDIELTQDILRDFFKSGKKFLTAPDGSSISISNKEIFDEIEDMIKLGEKDADHYHKAALYRLPWIYELTKLNPAIKIHGNEYLDEMYECLKKRSLKEAVQPNYLLKPVLRTYQKQGYNWIKMLEKYKLNGILADDMGLGKTLQAISILTDLEPDSKSLVVCPKTLLFNWAAEIDKFNPQIKYIIYEGNKEERVNLLNNSAVQVIFCSYALIQNDLEIFKKLKFEYIILDEAQHIKNHNTLRAKAVKKLKSRFKLAMTGTPLENSIMELWSVFDFLMPGYLPGMKKFKELFSSDSDTKKQSDKIKQYISPFILRRKKQDVLIELPDKQEQFVYCPMTEKQEQKYLQILSAVKTDLFSEDNNEVNYITMLAALTRLRQICDHPGLINPEWLNEEEISGKMDTLKELLQEAVENNRKILIFSQYVKMLKVIENLVKKMNVSYEYMDGTTKNRKAAINHFNDNEKVRIFLISLKTGGFGINLTSADTVILVDPWWNPMVENQAIDRVHRMGQTKKVLVYKMITRGSVEEKIMVLQKRKRDLFENVIDSGEAVLKNLEFEELRSLFEYKE